MNKKIESLVDFLESKGIDKEEIQPYLSQIEKDLKNKKYGLVWEEQEEEVYESLKNNLPILKEVTEKEIKNNNDMANLLIEGDNLEILTALQYTHKNKVDIIYIDPPYNTGNKDFVYNDRFINKDDSWRHSSWLSFMNKRLKLAKELLSENGVIFISIDDNEFAQLKLLCDEIYGESNFVDCIVWDKKSSAKGVPPKNMIVNVHEYILVYQKSNKFKFNGIPRSKESFSNPDNDPRGPWRNSNIKSTTKSKSEAFEIIDPATGVSYIDTWAFSKDTLYSMIEDDRLIFPKNKTGQVRQKEFYNEFKNQNIPIKSNIGLFDSQSTTELLKDMLYPLTFNNPKPLQLMSYLLSSVGHKNSIVLDFFAGSGTTGHAVLKLNKEDGGNRQFILCTNNENNICEDITYQRLSKAINGYTNIKGKEIEGIGGNLKYYKVQLEENLEDSDENNENLIDKCVDLVAIKEDCFNKKESNDEYELLESQNKVVLVYKNVLALDYEVEDISKILNSYDNKTKIIYTTNTSKNIDGIEIKEYPSEIINQLKIKKNSI